MKRILIGLIVAAVLAAGGWFGFNLYANHRASEVEAAFEQMRASAARPSHGKIAFDAMSRTLTSRDINVESAGPELVNVKIAKITAVGVRQPDEARSLGRRPLTCQGSSSPSPTERAKLKANYKIPEITARDVSGRSAQPTFRCPAR